MSSCVPITVTWKRCATRVKFWVRLPAAEIGKGKGGGGEVTVADGNQRRADSIQGSPSLRYSQTPFFNWVINVP